MNTKETKDTKSPKDIKDTLTEKEKKLIELIHSMEYGELSIFIQQGQPVRVEEVKKSIKL